MTSYCPRCEKELSASAADCPYCNADFSSTAGVACGFAYVVLASYPACSADARLLSSC